MPAQTPRSDRPNPIADDLARVVAAARDSRVTRVVLLATRDREHALTLVKDAVLAAGCALHHFTVAGRRRLDAATLRWESVGSESADAFELLRQATDLRGGGVVVLEDCATYLRDDGGDTRVRMRLAQALSPDAPSEGSVLVFLEPPEAAARLPQVLASQFVRWDIPYPRASELDALSREEIAAAAHRARAAMSIEEIRATARSLSPDLVGLTQSAARDAVRDAIALDPRDSAGAHARLQARKAEQLGRELAMNILDTANVEHPVGLENLTAYLDVHRPRVGVHGRDRARGVLLLGPPGTGKTMLARSIGATVGLPVVEFRIAALMNSLLGETERRFDQAFSTLEAMAPNVVFIDELEKAFGDSSERDGGTMMRCTGSLLSWLSENPHANFIVATCNSLRRMGEIGFTMTRSERFDACFFVDVPGREARAQMLERWLLGRVAAPAAIARRVATKTERFSGADLRSIVKEAVARATHDGTPLDERHLENEVSARRLRALAVWDEFSELRRWGRTYCLPAGVYDA